MKTLTLLTIGKNTCEALHEQLIDLLGDRVHVEAYYLESNIKKLIGKDLIILSSPAVLELGKNILNPNCPRIVALRSINYQGMEPLLTIPNGTQALLVNDTDSSVSESISFLKTIGMNHIKYFDYYPGIADYPHIKLAITPGETDLVPECVEHIIDIQNRSIDFITLVEILKYLDLLDEKMNLLSAKYVRGMVNLLVRNKQMEELNQHINNQLEIIINTVRDGIIAIDDQRNITVFNSIAEELLGFPCEVIIGKNMSDTTIRADIRELLAASKNDRENFHYINGRHLVVNSAVFLENKNQLIANHPKGRVYTLNDVTEIQRMEEEHRRELINQQNFARYTFAHILGSSEMIQTTKRLAQKIARSDSPILILGESGTGKELFAQGIHNASARKNGPFIAVNFAALSENLLESELFGYEEGAFTGAKKGGMSGLFQQAHKGTIFLDEIGDAPLTFQVKLLRVLQEKQVRRIGSSRVIPIDVRVIVATNRNLKELIIQGLFRQDLYYRLNVLPIKIPPLRQRNEDILILAKYFYEKYLIGSKLHPAEDYFRKIEEFLLAYSWPGNIRELQNVVEYLISICPDQPPVQKMLPEELREDFSNPSPPSIKDPYQYSLILRLIAQANDQDHPIGRRSLALQTGLTEGVVRKLLMNLELKGLVIPNRGRRGVALTTSGIEYVKESLNI